MNRWQNILGKVSFVNCDPLYHDLKEPWEILPAPPSWLTGHILRKDCLIAPIPTADYAKNIVKIARRIEFASIYPPNALNEMQKAIIEFDDLQEKEQAGLRLIDIILFPAGTIVASGPSCSEQGLSLIHI